MTKIVLYDTTLRDGMQAEGVSFSLEDKLSIAQALEGLGVHYIEGGYAASNDKEMQFFLEAAKLGLKNSKLAAFGSTRRADGAVDDDASLNAILELERHLVPRWRLPIGVSCFAVARTPG